MTTQLPLLEESGDGGISSIVTPSHVNFDISGRVGLQDVPSVPGLKIFEEFLTPEEQSECVKRVDAAVNE